MKSLAPWVGILVSTAMQGVWAIDGVDAYRIGKYQDATKTLPALSEKDPLVDYYLGRMRLYGYGELKNNTLALKHFQLSAEKGYLPAQEIMGGFSLLKEKNLDKALYWYKKAAESNSLNAQMYCGAAYLYGLGTKKNTDLAKKYITQAARNGNSTAQYYLAVDFLSTKHAANKKLGLIWLNKALAQGDLNAQVKLAQLYSEGNGVSKDIAKAKELLKESIAKNYHPAQVALGELALEENNIMEARKWFLKAANSQYIPGQIALSQLYFKTNTSLFNPHNGFLWLLKAAQNNSPEAQSALAKLYEDGRIFPPDPELAKEWRAESNKISASQANAEKNVAQWISGNKTNNLAALYKLPGIFSEWNNPKALKENTYNAAPQMQQLSREDIFKPQFTMITPDQIPLNEYYTALSASLGEVKDSYTYHTYPIDLHYSSSEMIEPASSFIGGLAVQKKEDVSMLGNLSSTPDAQAPSSRKISELDQLREQAILGDPGAQFTLAQRLQSGIGVSKNINQAIQFYKLAAAQEELNSFYNLGMLYLQGKDTAQDLNQALYWLNEGAFKGNMYSQFALGTVYEKGVKDKDGKVIITPDPEQALSLYSLASSNSYGPAQYRLAELLVRDQKQGVTLQEKDQQEKLIKRLYAGAVENGVKEANLPLAFFNAMDPNKEKQKQAFTVAEKEAAQGNNAQATLLLGLLYDRGTAVDADKGEALKWYQRAPHNHVSDFILGTYYTDGKFINQDLEKGKSLLQAAANTDFAYADLNLAILKKNNGEDFLKDLESATAKGNAQAGKLLADYYLARELNGTQLQRAKEIYKGIAEKGDAEAELKLGFILENGWGGPSDFAGAQEWYTRAANNKNEVAAYLLGSLYQRGKGEASPNYSEAKKWYEQAKLTYPPAAVALGFINETVDDNYDNAYSNYKWAADKGNAIGLYDVGLIFENGKGRPVSLDIATEFFEKAAKQKHPEAMVELADITLQNKLSAKDETRGYELLKQSAAMGNRDALYQLGLLSEAGVGTELNLTNALNYYQQAAEKGNVKSMLALARMYQFGVGTNKDIQKAAEQYKEAAALNNPYAQYQLASFYYEGKDGSPRPEEGKKMLEAAALNGNIQAKNALQWINAQSQPNISYLPPVPHSLKNQEITTLPVERLYLDAISEWNRGNENLSKKILARIIIQYPQFVPAKKAFEQIHQPNLLSFKQLTAWHG
jgi:enhanced entry protein EnhC